MNNKDIELYKRFQQSPLLFVEKMFGLVPELDNSKFIKGKHLTKHQFEILLGVEKALKGEASKRISVASGHGIGKSACIAWLILWYMFCFKDCQVGATAPTADQIHDVLWKELAVWLGRMPEPIKDLYELSAGYLRIRERQETWFARARTARKEAPEAFAGLHGKFVLLVADEASGIPEEIYATAEGSLTDKNTLVILISNPTRLIGYFYDTHHRDKINWQTFQFSSLDSPLVDKEYNQRIIEKHGLDSDEYRIRVLGQFPKADAVDDKGFVPLLLEEDIKFTENENFIGLTRLGIDPSGEGSDKSVWAVRDRFKVKIASVEQVSNSKSIAQRTLTLLDLYGIKSENATVDNFGEGANVARDIALSSTSQDSFFGKRIQAVNVGEKPEDEERFINKRAEGYYRLKQWLRSGGEIVRNQYSEELKKQLLSVRYRAELNGKMKIMSKEDMRKIGISSPDCADAVMLTFVGEFSEGEIVGSHRAKQLIPKIK